jgi:hypothetical protein
MSQITIEEDAWGRFILICKPEQSGKTFVMIQLINKDLHDSSNKKRVINFIFCDNSLLLTKQTSERVSRDVLPYTNETYVEFSSRNDGTAQRNKADVFTKIVTRKTNNIICCTNGTRVSDISKIISDLNSVPEFDFEFKIWLDECDKFTKFISKTFLPLAVEHKNVHVYCLTATPKTLFDKYRYMNVHPLHQTTRPDYHGWQDNNLVIVENSINTTEGFIHEILSGSHCPDLVPGSKWYIPADRKKISHSLVRDILLGKGFAVFIVNGDGLSLTLPGGQGEWIEDKNEELNKQMLKMYKKYNVVRFPVAVTGNICVGRGISIMSPDFMFDYGILSNCAKKSEASQNAGRLKGNIKGWNSYKKPTVFTTEKFNLVATDLEEKSRRLAILAFEKHEAGENTIVTKTELNTLNENHKFIKHPELFPTMKAVREFFAQEKIYKTCMRLDKPPKPQCINKKLRYGEKMAGYAISTKLLNNGQTANDLTANDRITVEKSKEIGEGRCISTTKKGSRFLVLPVYINMDTPADQEKYEVRYLSYNK